MCRASRVSAEIHGDEVPFIDQEIFKLIKRDCVPGGTTQNLETAKAVTDWGKTTPSQRILFADAQTSGGLLLCVSPKHFKQVLRLLKQYRTVSLAMIGKITRPQKRLLCMTE
jgi:selenide,water dikinase